MPCSGAGPSVEHAAIQTASNGVIAFRNRATVEHRTGAVTGETSDSVSSLVSLADGAEFPLSGLHLHRLERTRDGLRAARAPRRLSSDTCVHQDLGARARSTAGANEPRLQLSKARTRRHAMSSLAPMAEAVGRLLKARNKTVAVSESSTGGLICAALLAVPGASAFFLGGGVIYTHKAREVLLRTDLEDRPGMRPSTEAYALLQATAIRDLLGTDWGIGETGAAGPSGNRYGDPAGHSCIAVCGPGTRSMTLETGRADREENMWRFARQALEMFEDVLRR